MNKTIPSIWPVSKFNGIAFITGEPPNDDEIVSGRLFSGPSGRILKQACQVAGINLDECFIGNVFNSEITDNDIDTWCAGSQESKTWDGLGLPSVTRGKFLRPEHYHHLDRVTEELKKLKPNVIIPLGSIALWAFNGLSNIKQHRGAIAEASMTFPGAKIMPTFHPAMVLFVYKYFPILVFDLLKAKGERLTKEISYTPREIMVEPSMEEIKAFKQAVMHAPYLSIDIETIPFFRQITCIGFADSINRAIVIPFVDKRQPDNSYWRSVEEEVEALGLVQDLCKKGVVKIGQNFTYDLQWVLVRWGISVLGYSEDTRLQHHALYPELPKDLGFLGSCYAKEKSWKMYRGDKSEKRDE